MAVYCDRLCVSAAVHLTLYRRTEPHHYLDASPAGLRIARFLHTIGLLKSAPQPYRLHCADISNETGENQFFAILDAVRTCCLKAGREDIFPHPFVQGFHRTADAVDFACLLEKILSEELTPYFAAIHAFPKTPKPLFLVRKAFWSRYVQDYGRSRGVSVATYPAFDAAPAGALLRRSYSLLAGRSRAILARFRSAPKGPPAAKAAGPAPGPVIANWHTGQKIAFDDKNRTAFYWLIKSPIPRSRVLVYFNRQNTPLSPGSAACLAEHGMHAVALAPQATAAQGIPAWQPGALYAREQKASLRLVGRALAATLCARSTAPSFFSVNALVFSHQYAYWRDFFTRYGVKVSISLNDFTRPYLAKNAALRDCGGVSVSYQFSNLWFSSLQMSNCSDVVFSFGPAYLPFWKSNNSSARYLIYTGYLSDYSFKTNRPAALELRRRLLAAGARQIVCFFDENSSDDPMCLISHERTRQVYRAFLEKVLREPGLGLICKPGYPRTLRQRLGPDISALIEQARDTGRCVFVEDGDYATDAYPTLAAQAADVCVGLLLSGTVALEAFLSGTPTVFLDLEKLYFNPIYPKGKNRIVFDSLDRLFAGLDAFLRDRTSIPGFGDLADWAKGRDPFRDGRAAERAGRYINNLYEAFARGEDREAALASANDDYRAQWGQDSIVPLREAPSAP